MGTITAYGTDLVQISGFNSKANISGLEYLTDLDESTAATFDRIYKSENINFLIGNFDFTAIPAGSVINSVAMIAGATTQTNITVHIIECRKYTNGSYVSQGSDTSEQFVKSNDSGDFTFTSRIGTWTRNELAIPPVAGVQNGPWFYVRIKNSSSLSYNDAYLRYFKMVVDYTPPSYTITVNASPTAGGTVTGGGVYENGKTATLTAKANAGYKFKQWNDGNTSATRTVTVTSNITYTAQFEKLTYNISATASPAEGGTVNGAGVYSYGDTATLTAEPTLDGTNNKVFQFKQWSDGDTSNPRTVTVTGDATYTAEFEQLYMCNAGALPAEGGTVTANASVTSDLAEGLYPSGTTVTFTATANEGYKFVNWTNGETSETLTVTVGTSNALYFANFEKEITNRIFIGVQEVMCTSDSFFLGTKEF